MLEISEAVPFLLQTPRFSLLLLPSPIPSGFRFFSFLFLVQPSITTKTPPLLDGSLQVYHAYRSLSYLRMHDGFRRFRRLRTNVGQQASLECHLRAR